MPYSGLNNYYLTSNPYLNYGYNFPVYDFTQNSNFNYGYYPSTNPFDTTSNYPFNNWNFNNLGIPSTDINYLMGNVPITNNPTSAPLNNPTFTGKEQPQEEKKGLSKGAKWGIGIAVATAVALGVELIGFKGKHLKSLKQKLTNTADAPDAPKNTGNKPTTETPSSNPQPEAPKPEAPKPEAPNGTQETPKPEAPTSETPKKSSSQLVDDGVKFTKLDEAKEYFENAGIKTFFTDGTENCLADLNTIKKDLITLQKNGVEVSKPSSIVFTDWRKKSEMEDICRRLNLPESAVTDLSAVTNSHSGYWGTVEYLKDGQNIVFINNSFGSDYGRFIHEMGHLHQDLETSFWHSKGFKGEAFKAIQHKILGLPKPTQIITSSNPSYSNASLNDIFRNSCQGGIFTRESSLRNQINNLFPELNGKFESVFFVPIKNSEGKIEQYYINAKKMIEKMASESHVYAPDIAFENVAEIFQGLNRGEKYSDEVMLMYDFCGGGRVPNLVINGKKYDDYIESLYNNPTLLQKLRDCIEIKKV